MTSLAFLQRVHELQQRYSKEELARRCENAGHLGGMYPLAKWSKQELATEAARAEQGATA